MAQRRYGEESLMHRAALHKLRALSAPDDGGTLLDKLRGKVSQAAVHA